eukprot:1791145-Prymnesium_polylepis.1
MGKKKRQQWRGASFAPFDAVDAHVHAALLTMGFSQSDARCALEDNAGDDPLWATVSELRVLYAGATDMPIEVPPVDYSGEERWVPCAEPENEIETHPPVEHEIRETSTQAEVLPEAPDEDDEWDLVSEASVTLSKIGSTTLTAGRDHDWTLIPREDDGLSVTGGSETLTQCMLDDGYSVESASEAAAAEGASPKSFAQVARAGATSRVLPPKAPMPPLFSKQSVPTWRQTPKRRPEPLPKWAEAGVYYM